MAFTSKLNINLSPKQHQDAFDLESSFILSSKASNGIHPGIKPVKLQVGPFITTIPAGSFKKRQDSSYTYEGMSDGVKLAVKIDLTGTLRYRLRAKVTDSNLSGITNPVQVSLSVGGGAGLVSVKADLAGTLTCRMIFLTDRAHGPGERFGLEGCNGPNPSAAPRTGQKNSPIR
jgi:hypothetical protein